MPCPPGSEFCHTRTGQGQRTMLSTTWAPLYIYICMYIYMCVCMYSCTSVYVHIYIKTCVYTYLFIYLLASPSGFGSPQAITALAFCRPGAARAASSCCTTSKQAMVETPSIKPSSALVRSLLNPYGVTADASKDVDPM